MSGRVVVGVALVGFGAVLGGCSDGVSPDGLGESPGTRLLTVSDLAYEGAFRLPAATYGVSSLNFSEGPIDVKGPSLLVVGHSHHQAIAEFRIPSLGKNDDLEALNMAGAPVQPFASVLDRAPANPQGLDRIAALRRLDSPRGEVLVVNAYEYYDAPADNTHTTLIVEDPSQLDGSVVNGFYALSGGAHAGGWVSDVPLEWQEALGGDVLVGSSSGVPIIGRLSVGPSAFAVSKAELTTPTASADPIPAATLLDYSLANPLEADLSNSSQANARWTHLSRGVYGFIPPGTATYVVVGHSGGHGPEGVCYKCVPVGLTAACGGYCPVDPQDRSLFYWFYDVGDLARVRAGELAPHDVRPYESGRFDAPFSAGQMGGGSFDAESGLLYLSLLKADRLQGTYANPPVVVAYRISG